MFILINTISDYQVGELKEEGQEKKDEVAYLNFDSDFLNIKRKGRLPGFHKSSKQISQ